MGLTLREVKKLVGNSVVDLPRMSPEDIKSSSAGNPMSFYLQASDVILYPTPNATKDTLRLSYYKTPSKLVETTSCALITSIDSVTGIITADCPSTWSTSNTFDFVSKRNGHKNHSTDLTASSVTSTTITFATSDVPSSLIVGDYVCLAGETPFCQVPDVCFDLIVRLAANDLLESMGDTEGLGSGMSKVQTLQNNVVTLLTSRVAGSLKKSIIKAI